MISRVIKILIGVVLISFVLFLFPIGKLILTDTAITKALFIDQYYAKISAGENDLDVFRDYMESKGWTENETLGGLLIFEKNGEIKRIEDTDIKTILIDGKLNIFFWKDNHVEKGQASQRIRIEQKNEAKKTNDKALSEQPGGLYYVLLFCR
jgi:hypothetical protein